MLWGLPAAGALLVLTGAVVVGVLLSATGDRRSQSGAAPVASADSGSAQAGAGAPGSSGNAGVPAAGRGAAAADPPLRISIATGRPGAKVPAGFLGLSFEFQAVRTYTGSDPRAVNPVLVQLIRNLTPGQAPVLRIGGDSTDVSYVPGRGVHPPPYVDYRLTPSWLATTSALQRQLGARMILGLNLAANQPALASTEARADIAAFGPRAVDALEIGNEPNVYSKVTVEHTVFGLPVSARPKSFGYRAFHRQFDAIAAAAPKLTLAGPALAIGPTPSSGSWVNQMPTFLRGDRRIATMTVHRYPLRNCYVPPSSPQYPSIAHLLSAYATTGLAGSLRRWIRIAHGAHRTVRVDELNSVACRGKPGVSDTFASALWATDALFSLVRAGLDGVDMHTLPNAAYELFAFSHTGGRWRGEVRPVYYGLQLFAEAAPAGSRLLSLGRHGTDAGLSTWATRAPDGRVRVVLINKNTASDRKVTIAVPAGTGTGATVERMLAPSAGARHGVTLGGRSYGPSTATGHLASPEVTRLATGRGRVTVSVPRASAALVTLG
jgi:hypothetical protein